MCDDIIVLDSDDDEDDLPCSQLFNSSRKEKDSGDIDLLGSFREIDDIIDCEELYDNRFIDPVDCHGLIKWDACETIEESAADINNRTANRRHFGSAASGPADLIIHSQLSPETYMERVDNMNELGRDCVSLEGSVNLLEALMSQSENLITDNACKVYEVNSNISDIDKGVSMESARYDSSLPIDRVSNPHLNEPKTEQDTAIAREMPSTESVLIRKSSRSAPNNCTCSISAKTNHAHKSTPDVSNVKVKTDIQLPSCKVKKKSDHLNSESAHLRSNSNKCLKESSNLRDSKNNLKRKISMGNTNEPKIKSTRLSKVHLTGSDKKPSDEKLEENSSSNIRNKRLIKRPKSGNAEINNIYRAGNKLADSLSKKAEISKPMKEAYHLRPSEKRKIQDMRKKKLHEVAMKEKLLKSSERPRINAEFLLTVSEENKCFVKNTGKNRGTILIDSIPPKLPERRRKSLKDEKINKLEKESYNKKQTDKTRRAFKSCENTEDINRIAINKNMNASEKTEKTQVNNSSRRKSILKGRDSLGTNKNITFAGGNDFIKMKSYEKDNLSAKTNRMQKSSDFCRTVYLKGSPKSSGSLIHLFCKWNPKWIEVSSVGITSIVSQL